ncbi:MAG TPA: hypothetical protein VMJ32_17300 [Pirellulales bacterium]|nr:hypothetical protein [Pirellulales bacterium]
MARQTQLSLLSSIAFYVMLSAISEVPADDSVMTKALSTSSSSEQSIKQALSDKTSFDFRGVPLSDAMQAIAEKHHILIQVDNTALKAAGIDPTTTQVTMVVKDITLRSALNLLLSQYELAALIKNETLLFTTKAKADSMFETRLYDVRDLILHDYNSTGTVDFDSLVDAIKSTINPQSWDKAGGQGSVATFSDNGVCALIVWQNYDGHEQLETLLQGLRQLKPQRAVNQ